MEVAEKRKSWRRRRQVELWFLLRECEEDDGEGDDGNCSEEEHVHQISILMYS